jgi:hypothetical protein
VLLAAELGKLCNLGRLCIRDSRGFLYQNRHGGIERKEDIGYWVPLPSIGI